MAKLRRLAVTTDCLAQVMTGTNRPYLQTLIEGQILDLPFEDKDLFEDRNWDAYTSLPKSDEAKGLTAFDDLRANRVRDPIIEIVVTPKDRPKDVLGKQAVEINNSEGVFRLEQLKLSRYTDASQLESDLDYYIHYKATDSLRQKVFDVSNAGKIQIAADGVIGRGKIKVLPPDYEDYIITSDIDATWLNTDIQSTRGKTKTLFETAEEKSVLPGMTELFKQLGAGLTKAGKGHHLKFISASPFFFRRLLGQLFRSEGLDVAAVHLKDLQGILNNLFYESISNITNFNKLFEKGMPSIQRASNFLEPYIQNFFDQTGYKLILLLRNRLSFPRGTQEILIGDNTETDFLIFALYKKILEEEDQPADWVDYFQNFTYHGKRVLTKQQIASIVKLISRVREYLEHPRPCVPFILIHRADGHISHTHLQEIYEQYDIPYQVLPVPEKDESHKTVYLCENALHMSEVFVNNGLIEKEQVDAILKTMVGKTLRNQSFDAGYFRRRERQTGGA